MIGLHFKKATGKNFEFWENIKMWSEKPFWKINLSRKVSPIVSVSNLDTSIIL